jgi:hypothetical protein
MVDDITMRRWEKNDKPGDHKPVDMIRVFLARLEAGEIDPNHVVIVYSNEKRDVEGSSGYYQAGDLGYYGQMGLMTRALHLMNGAD